MEQNQTTTTTETETTTEFISMGETTTEFIGMVPHKVHQTMLWIQMLVGVWILVANILTLLSLTKARQLQLSLRVLLGNMALADSTVGLVFIFNCIVFYQPHILNSVTCFIRYGTINTSITVSMMNVALLALDRCFTIKFPFQYPQWASFKMTALIVAISWVLCVILAIVAYYEKIFQARVCTFLEIARIPAFVLPGCVFFTSFAVVIVCYVFIAKDIRKHIRQIAQTTHTGNPSLSAQENNTNNLSVDNSDWKGTSESNNSRDTVESITVKPVEDKAPNIGSFYVNNGFTSIEENMENFDDAEDGSAKKDEKAIDNQVVDGGGVINGGANDINEINNSKTCEARNMTNNGDTPRPSTAEAEHNNDTPEKSQNGRFNRTEAPIFITNPHDPSRKVGFNLPIPLQVASSLTVPQNNKISQKVKENPMKKYFAATKTVTIILAVFFGCNSPLSVYLLHLAVNPDAIQTAAVTVNSLLFLMVLNSLANPIIYTWKMKQLRKGFLLFFCKNRCSERIVDM